MFYACLVLPGHKEQISWSPLSGVLQPSFNTVNTESTLLEDAADVVSLRMGMETNSEHRLRHNSDSGASFSISIIASRGVMPLLEVFTICTVSTVSMFLFFNFKFNFFYLDLMTLFNSR